MNIRLANKFDIPLVKDFLREYSKEAHYSFLQVHDEAHIDRLLTSIIAGAGRIILGGDLPHGMLMSIRQPNIWNPSILIEHELAFWIDPEYRNTRTAWRLLKEYKDKPLSGCVAQIISTYDIELFNPVKFEYRQLETFYVKELQCPEQ